MKNTVPWLIYVSNSKRTTIKLQKLPKSFGIWALSANGKFNIKNIILRAIEVIENLISLFLLATFELSWFLDWRIFFLESNTDLTVNIVDIIIIKNGIMVEFIKSIVCNVLSNGIKHIGSITAGYSFMIPIYEKNNWPLYMKLDKIMPKETKIWNDFFFLNYKIVGLVMVNHLSIDMATRKYADIGGTE